MFSANFCQKKRQISQKIVKKNVKKSSKTSFGEENDIVVGILEQSSWSLWKFVETIVFSLSDCSSIRHIGHIGTDAFLRPFLDDVYNPLGALFAAEHGANHRRLFINFLYPFSRTPCTYAPVNIQQWYIEMKEKGLWNKIDHPP